MIIVVLIVVIAIVWFYFRHKKQKEIAENIRKQQNEKLADELMDSVFIKDVLIAVSIMLNFVRHSRDDDGVSCTSDGNSFLIRLHIQTWWMTEENVNDTFSEHVKDAFLESCPNEELNNLQRLNFSCRFAEKWEEKWLRVETRIPFPKDSGICSIAAKKAIQQKFQNPVTSVFYNF